ncbi:putative ribonuclease H-like domain-containing protein [Tanacetum coccineum]
MAGADDENPPPPVVTPTQQAPHTVSTIKLPILKKGEYDIWAMKMEHYLAHTDYPIWEVIQRGNGPVSVSTDTNGQIKVLPPKTAEEILAREKERKARTTLLMAIPEDHLAKFHKMTDAKEMWDAIKSRFGGNDESKKMQKYILKQQFEGFSVSNSEGLHKGYDRFQSLLSQLEIHGAGVSTEDANQKFLSSTGSSSSTQNVAFVSSESTSSTNDVSTAYGATTSSGYNSQRENSSSYTDELMHSFFANQSSGPQLDHEDLEQIDEFDLEEMDLKWQVAMISMRLKKFYKKTGRKIQFDAKEPVGFDKTKVECFNCHKKGYFARECRSKGNQDIRRRDAGNTRYKAKDNGRRPGKQEEPKALVTLDGDGVDWTGHAEDKQENFALMAYSHSGSDTKKKLGLGFSEQVKENELYDEALMSVFDSHSSDIEDAPVYDKFAKSKTSESDAKTSDFDSCESNSSVETLESMPEPVVIKPKVNKKHLVKHVKTHRETVKEQNTCNQSPKVDKRDWNGLMSKKLGLGYGFTRKACFVCGSFGHLIRDCDFHEKRMAKQVELNKKKSKGIGQGENRTIWNKYAKIESPKQVCSNNNDPQQTLKGKGIVDSGCSRNMTGNKAYLVDYQEFKGGFVVFRGSKGKITGKGKIRTGKLDIDDVYFVKELQDFNLFSMSQMCDKKNKVLFTDTECLVLSPDFKLPDDNQILLRIPRQNNMYSFNLENIVPTGEFKNRDIIELCGSKRIKREYSNARTPQQNGVARAKELDPYDVAKTMLAESFLTNTLGMKYYIRPFGCHVTILNTIDHLGKFEGKSDEGFLVGYSLNSKAFRPLRSKNQANKTAGPKEANHSAVKISETKNEGKKPNRDTGLKTNEEPVDKEDQAFLEELERLKRQEKEANDETKLLKEFCQDIRILLLQAGAARATFKGIIKGCQHCLFACFLSQIEPKKISEALEDESWVDAMREEQLQFKIQKGYRQEEGIDYDEVFALVARTEAIRIFLAFASYMGFIVYQMDVKSALCFVDPKFLKKVYKVVKALYGLHQAPRAWYATLSTFLFKSGYRRGTINKTLFIKKDNNDIMSSKKKMTVNTPIGTQKPLVKDEEVTEVDIHLYRSMIGSLMYLTASRPDILFVVCACSRFQVTLKTLHLHAVKRIFRYLKGKQKLDLWYPRVSVFDLEGYSDSDYAGVNLDRKSTTGGCQFLGRRLISWQCKKQTIVATSTTKVEYVAAANCCGQVLWIQNQLLDYGFNFMNTKIYIDNEITICIVKNLVFHSKTKHIKIRHHFIRDAYEKKLIQVLKIHTDDNVADLLSKAFDVSRFNFLIVNIGMLNLYPLIKETLERMMSLKLIVESTSESVSAYELLLDSFKS